MYGVGTKSEKQNKLFYRTFEPFKLIIMATKGRPTLYSEEVVKEILSRLTTGESGRSICRDENMPAWGTLSRWKRENEGFRNQYAQAAEDGWDYKAEELEEIARNESRDQVPDGKGGFKSDNTAVNRDRLIIDTLKWSLSKKYPKKYGDKITNELTGAEGVPLVPVLNLIIEGVKK